MKKVFGFDSFELKNKDVELYVTKEGGQMAPVTFFPESGDPIQPYYINPWADEKRDESLPMLLQALRGDFFCMPFGGNNTTAEFSYPPHGYTANADWTLKSSDEHSLTISLDFPDGKAHVESTYATKPEETNLYITNRVTGCSLTLPVGHHAILGASRTLLISTSPLKFCAVASDSDKPYGDMEYRAMPGRAVFRSLENAPSRISDFPSFDVSVFPAREGYVDIVQAVNDNSLSKIGWSCAVCPEGGYLWFSVKDTATFPSTALWMENRGRHGKPWSSRNVCIGIEDSMTCYADGAAVSCFPNDLTRLGIQTTYKFTGDNTLKIIEGVVRVSSDFSKVRSVDFKGGKAVFTDVNGKSVSAALDISFLA